MTTMTETETFCYRCGYSPCLYAEQIAAGALQTCVMQPRPYTAGEWAWDAIYDAALERVGYTGTGALMSAAMTDLRRRY